jgi:PERQ amino acid-rich with GYF domain-containing protein
MQEKLTCVNQPAEEIVTSLLSCPPEVDLLTEAVHSVSQTIDSRHFAEEFLRRRKLADRGIVEGNALASEQKSAGATGGWNEVAKKGGSSAPKEETPSNFKVVAAKKKGGKR